MDINKFLNLALETGWVDEINWKDNVVELELNTVRLENFFFDCLDADLSSYHVLREGWSKEKNGALGRDVSYVLPINND